MSDDLYELGLKTRREVLGDTEVDTTLAATDGFTEDLEREMTRYAWGEVWSRPGLDRRTRISITVAMLAVQGLEEELAVYVRAAIRNGITIDEVMEIIHQAGLYAGAPMGNRALAVVRDAVLDFPKGDAK